MRKDEPTDDCPACYGLGREVRLKPIRFGQPLPPARVCPACNGTGKKRT